MARAVLFTRQQLPTVAGELQRLWRHDLADDRNTPLTAAVDLSIDDIAFAADGRKLWLQAEQPGSRAAVRHAGRWQRI